MDDKTFYPATIQDNPFPEEGTSTVVLSGEGGSVATPTALSERPMPTKRIAVELLSSALNTKSQKILKEFQFASMGAIRIGDYTAGEYGEIKISPNGIVGKNRTGVTTFAIDGDTGDATFAGTIQTGTLIAGDVIVGDNSLRFDGENRRIIVNDGANDRIVIGNLNF